MLIFRFYSLVVNLWAHSKIVFEPGRLVDQVQSALKKLFVCAEVIVDQERLCVEANWEIEKVFGQSVFLSVFFLFVTHQHGEVVMERVSLLVLIR